MILKNGRGQLGDELLKYVDYVPDDVIIYHTWNFLDKSEEVQSECLKKFCFFMNTENYDSKKIVFISTYTNTYTSYLKYKMKAEQTLYDMDNAAIIRLPNIIGKGLCEGFKNNTIIPDEGVIELISIEDAACEILDNINNCFYSGNNNKKIIRVKGIEVPVKLAYELIKFGQKK